MRTILIIAAKDLLLRWRDRLGFFWWIVGFPLLIAVLIGSIFASVVGGPSRAMRVAVIDEDDSVASRAFIEELRGSATIAVSVTTRAAAQEGVRRGRMGALLVLDHGFRVSPGLLWGQSLPIGVGIDPSRKAELAFVEAAVNESAIRLLRRQWLDPEQRQQLIDSALADLQRQGSLGVLERKGIERVLDAFARRMGAAMATSRPGEPADAMPHLKAVAVDAARVRPRSSFEICFPLGIIWGLLGLAAEFAMANVHEREAGTLLRLRAAPIRRFHVLVGNGLACFVSCLAVTLYLLIIGRFVFGIRIQNVAGVALAMLCIAACFVGITMMLSILGRTESSVGGAAWACLLVMAMLGGGMVPQIFLPDWMETAGNVSPVRWAIMALEGGIWRGFTLREMGLPCGVLLFQGGLCAAVGLIFSPRLEH